MANTVAGKLARVCLGEDEVTLEACINDLNDDVLVGEADDEAVLGGIVLVLGLGNEAFASIV